MNTSEILPERKTDQLRKGRVSIPAARYFLTCCCKRPAQQLVRDPIAGALLQSWLRMQSDGDMSIMVSTVMPDHVHLLFRLTGRLKIGQVIGKMKAITKPILEQADLTWQRDFHEHRLRPNELANPYAFYIYMNPYRENLVSREEVWPHWYQNPGEDFDFFRMLEGGLYPPKAWITCDVQKFGLRREAVGE